MSKEEYVTVEIPKVVVDSVQKQDWFKMYSDFEEFVMAAINDTRLKWMSCQLTAKQLVDKWKEAKAKNPNLDFADFLTTIL